MTNAFLPLPRTTRSKLPSPACTTPLLAEASETSAAKMSARRAPETRREAIAMAPGRDPVIASDLVWSEEGRDPKFYLTDETRTQRSEVLT